jgi:formamidopyrimidine-DNA glycosylase
MMDYRTPSGARGSFRQFLRVYGREGEPCRRCRTSVERIIVAGRSSFFCPQCQPRPGERGKGRR